MLKSPIDELQPLFEFDQRPNLRPRYNIAPSQDVAIIRCRHEDNQPGGQGQHGRMPPRELVMARWGLVPFWSDDPKVGYKMINTRAETVDRLPSYRDAYKKRRCLIPTDGFFEWQVGEHKKSKAPKQPYLIRRQDQQPFAFAGLFERWTSPGRGEVIESCTIVTTAANKRLAPIHHRMPVVIGVQDYGAWLNAGTDGRPLLRPCPEDWLETILIGPRINKPAHDDESVIEPIDHPIMPAQGSLF